MYDRAKSAPKERASPLHTEAADTGEAPQPARAAEPRRVRRGRWWRGLTGSLAAGLVLLALAVAGAQVAGWGSAGTGPGAGWVTGHLAAAVLALVAQRFADRGRGLPAATAGATVLVLTGAVLWLFWW
ncbi:hypothetical protein [Qaidamihabitans albus]|uniref:hypothetical protein n=1 Tax=Qaidamihabitans albus TaxID=2795733 RepID=UPI0018F20243|nr:hypothetical protein [Qaidamihabitans albus]